MVGDGTVVERIEQIIFHDLRVGLRVESVKKADESQCDYGEEAAKRQPSDKRGERLKCAFHGSVSVVQNDDAVAFAQL